MTAVLVAHDGAAWLPEALAALQWQRRPPQRIVAVDTGSVDDTRQILDRELGASSVLEAPRTAGFGQAVAVALDAYAGAPEAPMPGRAGDGETVEWIWLLHDDCAPAPDALRQLLALGDTSPSVGVVGPKTLAWEDPRVLTEVGFTVDTSGRRETGLERTEIDQGQHDGVSDVLAVGTAGALVRRDVWDALGGFDPELPVFRDDLDFCWRAHLAGHRVCVAPQATVRHVSAAARGRRHVHAAPDRPRRVDRTHALYTLLVDLSGPGLVLTVPRIVIGTLLRVIGFVLTKRVGAALDDLAALTAVLRHPRRLMAARRRRATTRRLPHRTARPLLAKRSVRVRHNIDVAAAWVADRARGDDEPTHSVLETGPTEDEFDQGSSHVLRRLLLRPGIGLVLGLAVIALVAERGLLGSGALSGGRLLPPGGGAHDLWTAFGSAWHPVVTGTAADAPPYLAVLAVFSTILLGKVWLAVDVLMLGCVPLAGWAAYVAAGRVSRNRLLRVWAAATYALLPVATGVVATGRLGDAVAYVCIPLLLLAGARLVRADPGYDGWRHVGAAALLLAGATAFAPLLYVIALPALLVATVAVRLAAPLPAKGAAVRRTLAAALVAAAPLVLLWPWTGTVLSHPGLVLTVPGPAVAGLTARELPPWHLLAAAPGGPGTPLVWLTLPLLLAGLAGLARTNGRASARGLWAVALLALAAGIVVTHLRVSSVYAGAVGRVVGWSGVPAAVIGSAFVGAAVVAADGAQERLARRSFSWRQPIAALVAVAAAAIPVATALAWLIRGADDPVHRHGQDAIPAFAAAEGMTGTRPRVLELRADAGSALTYGLLRGRPLQLGEGDTPPRDVDIAQLSGTVEDLAASRGDDPAAALATYGVGFVLMPEPVDARLASTLDRTRGLLRRTTVGSGVIWQVTIPAGRVVLLPASTAKKAVAATAPPTDLGALQPAPTALPADEIDARAVLAPGEDGRLLVLAESADDGWRAEVNGQQLDPVTAWGWAQAFRVPPGGGSLHVWHSPGHRTGQLIVEAVLVGLVVLLAAPTPGGGRRRDDGGGVIA
ncbi:MAG: glycosyltransferase family 2 protein [Actinomycetes bacterium]